MTGLRQTLGGRSERDDKETVGQTEATVGTHHDRVDLQAQDAASLDGGETRPIAAKLGGWGQEGRAGQLDDAAKRRGDLVPRRRPLACLVAARDLECGQPAFGVYLRAADGTSHGVGLYVLTLRGDRISEMIRFEADVLSWFALPPLLVQVTRRG